MVPEQLTNLMRQQGRLEHYSADQVFHAQNFDETLFMLKTGYVKRYQVTDTDNRIIELIYGPGHIFPLSQLYKRLFGIEQNQENLIYVYQAMTDIEIFSMQDNAILEVIESNHDLYIDLFYEAGLRLKSNIERLASNALKDEYQKVAHQLFCLANEFGKTGSKDTINILVPLRAVDMAEQLNVSTEVADAVMASLVTRNMIAIDDNHITILDVNALKDVYL
jgi:CRP-like cAMP-binding protein